jgi:hypothetical protein
LGDIKGKGVDTIDEEEIGRWVQAQDCLLHGHDGGLQDVMFLDCPWPHNPHPPAEGTSRDDLIELLSFARGEELGVPHAGDLIAWIDDNRRRHHRASQGASARFIHPRHPLVALGADHFFLTYLVGACRMALHILIILS